MKGIWVIFVVIFCVSIARGHPFLRLQDRPVIFENSPENVARLKRLRRFELPEEFSGQFEGDIVIGLKQIREVSDISSRNGLINKKYQWTNRTVPYFINETQFSKFQKEYIRLALNFVQNLTCIKFVERTREKDFVYFASNHSGCFSHIGKQGGAQILNLESAPIERGCFNFFTIIHELIHSLGFHHMQSSPNRDEYIQIIWENIVPTLIDNFRLIDNSIVTTFNLNYDYASVMHYSRRAFSKNGEPTIIPLKNPKIRIGQRNRLSTGDVMRVWKMYCTDLESNEVLEPEMDRNVKN